MFCTSTNLIEHFLHSQAEVTYTAETEFCRSAIVREWFDFAEQEPQLVQQNADTVSNAVFVPEDFREFVFVATAPLVFRATGCIRRQSLFNKTRHTLRDFDDHLMELLLRPDNDQRYITLEVLDATYLVPHVLLIWVPGTS